MGTARQEFLSLLPVGFESHEEEGLGLPLQLTFFVDAFIKRGIERKWYDAPGASQMGNQLNTMIDAYGRMETIKLTPIPIAHLYVLNVSFPFSPFPFCCCYWMENV